MTDPENVANGIKDTNKKLQDTVDEVQEKLSARQECYQKIVTYVKESVGQYYKRHQDRAGDDRGGDAMEWSVNGIKSIIGILNGYSISYRDGVHVVPPKELENEHAADTAEPQPGAPHPTESGNPQ